MKSKNLLLIWDRIGDYHLARIKACEKIMDVPVYTADLAGSDGLYKWESIDSARHTILSDKPSEKSDIRNRFKAFRTVIKEKKIHVVAMPYGRAEYLLFLVYARLCGIQTIVFCESWYSRGLIKDFLKSLLLKTIGQYFFVSGKKAFTHLTEGYHICASHVIEGYSVVDNNHFAAHANSYSDKRKNIVCIARYSKEKNLLQLINSFSKSRIAAEYRLLLVGDGPERLVLQQQIDALGLQGKITLSGWVSYAELPQVYATAACLVLPSTFEPWGLVVNEGMAAGLPILISEECGCLPDLLEQGANGWSFNIHDEKELIAVLDAFAESDIFTRISMSAHSAHLISAFTPELWASKMRALVQ